MSDFVTALARIRNHGEGIIDDAAAMLRQLVQDTCEAISAADGSIMVPSRDQTELEFLVSLNPTLETSGITVSVAESVSGYVFSSRQAMAKVRPTTAGASQVDELAQVETKFLLVVPIIDDDRVYGVATFVNRVGDFAETPFSIEDLKMAQGFGEIYATAMKLYQKIEFSLASAAIEIEGHAEAFNLEPFGADAPKEVNMAYEIPSEIAEKALAMPRRQQEMLSRIADVLGEFAEGTEEAGEGTGDDL